MSFLAIIIVVGAVVVALGIINEWRSWKRPLAPGLSNRWGSRVAGSGRLITGGHTADERHD
jgi:hypothetical protein